MSQEYRIIIPRGTKDQDSRGVAGVRSLSLSHKTLEGHFRQDLFNGTSGDKKGRQNTNFYPHPSSIKNYNVPTKCT